MVDPGMVDPGMVDPGMVDPGIAIQKLDSLISKDEYRGMII
jgi:hypothetical protein